jgi:hypothetical protein
MITLRASGPQPAGRGFRGAESSEVFAGGQTGVRGGFASVSGNIDTPCVGQLQITPFPHSPPSPPPLSSHPTAPAPALTVCAQRDHETERRARVRLMEAMAELEDGARDTEQLLLSSQSDVSSLKLQLQVNDCWHRPSSTSPVA